MLLKRSLTKNSVPRIRWQKWVKPWQQVDWLLFCLPIAISIFGGLMILSTQLSTQINTVFKQPIADWSLLASNIIKTDWGGHWITAAIGGVIALLLALVRYENFIQWHWVTYGLTNISLIAVMIAGHAEKGAQRWLGIAGFRFQPSEFAKIAIIITLAVLLHKSTASSLPKVFRALAITAVPWGLVFTQPDLATSMVFGAIVLGMLYWANANPGWLILMISPVIAAILDNVYKPGWIVWSMAMGLLAWQCLPWRRFGISAISGMALNLLGGELGAFAWNHVLKGYQKDRLTVFINPEHDPLGAGYHQIQSRIAIGAGEFKGSGLFHGPMTQLNFVPEQHTDFIFSAVGEEFGLIGGLILLFVFGFVCLRLLHIAQTAKDNLGSLLAIGVLSMIVFQLVVNVGMTVGLAPVAGIPLPWMSYGRSAMLTNFIALGIVESVANFRQRQRY